MFPSWEKKEGELCDSSSPANAGAVLQLSLGTCQELAQAGQVETREERAESREQRVAPLLCHSYPDILASLAVLPPLLQKKTFPPPAPVVSCPRNRTRAEWGLWCWRFWHSKHERKQASCRVAPRRRLQSSCCMRDLTSNIVNAFLITHKPFCSERIIIIMIKKPPL